MKLHLPVTPSGYEVTMEQNNEKVVCNNIGEIVLIGLKNVKTISFSGIFPFIWSPDCSVTDDELLYPEVYAEMIEAEKDAGNRIKVIFTGIFNVKCVIDSFSYSENGAEGGSYSISLSVYEKADTQREQKKLKVKKYKVKKGDTLHKIAKTQLGDSSKWKKIKEWNGLKKNTLKVGQELKIKKWK